MKIVKTAQDISDDNGDNVEIAYRVDKDMIQFYNESNGDTWLVSTDKINELLKGLEYVKRQIRNKHIPFPDTN